MATGCLSHILTRAGRGSSSQRLRSPGSCSRKLPVCSPPTPQQEGAGCPGGKGRPALLRGRAAASLGNTCRRGVLLPARRARPQGMETHLWTLRGPWAQRSPLTAFRSDRNHASDRPAGPWWRGLARPARSHSVCVGCPSAALPRAPAGFRGHLHSGTKRQAAPRASCCPGGRDPAALEATGAGSRGKGSSPGPGVEAARLG